MRSEPIIRLLFRRGRRRAGYTPEVPVHRLDEVLARTDPFDLAQAVDRHASELSAESIRGLLLRARPRMSAYYAREFAPLAEIEKEPALQAAFARLLKSNLRIIPLFGPAFCDALLANAPADRAVAIGEERPAHRRRAAAMAVIAVALLLGGAAAERFVSAARAGADDVTASMPPAAPALALRTPRAARKRHTRRIVRAPRRTAVPEIAQTASIAPAAPTFAPPPRRVHRVVRPAPVRVARGVAIVHIPQPAPQPVPNQTASLVVSDAPDAYSNATPLPLATARPAENPPGMRAATPPPKKTSWLHRTIMHLDPFKPHHP